MARDGQLPLSCSCRGCEAGLQTSKTGLEQPQYHRPHYNVGLVVGQELHAPLGDAATALRRDFNRAGVMRSGNPGDQRVAIEPPHAIDFLEALDDFPTVARFDPAELTASCAGQADPRNEWVPIE